MNVSCFHSSAQEYVQIITIEKKKNFYGFVVKEEGCPFIVCMAYAFHTTDKLCFILDLMNGKERTNVFE